MSLSNFPLRSHVQCLHHLSLEKAIVEIEDESLEGSISDQHTRRSNNSSILDFVGVGI